MHPVRFQTVTGTLFFIQPFFIFYVVKDFFSFSNSNLYHVRSNSLWYKQQPPRPTRRWGDAG